MCQLLAQAGCSLVAVHGRRRPPPGRHRGERLAPADLEAIRDVCAACACTGVALVTNGNTCTADDVAANLCDPPETRTPRRPHGHSGTRANAPAVGHSPTLGHSPSVRGVRDRAYTRADGLMACEAVLRNPTLFEQHAALAANELHGNRQHGADGQRDAAVGSVAAGGLSRAALAPVALEYLCLARAYPPDDVSVVRSHVMWMLGKSGHGERCTFEHTGPFSDAQLRWALVEAASVHELEAIVRTALGVAG
jgi:tRNA-dihydrouridine synthase